MQYAVILKLTISFHQHIYMCTYCMYNYSTIFNNDSNIMIVTTDFVINKNHEKIPTFVIQM